CAVRTGGRVRQYPEGPPHPAKAPGKRTERAYEATNITFGSRGQTLDRPGTVGAPQVLEPIVHPVGPSLPELDLLGHEPESAPVVRSGDLPARFPHIVEPLVEFLELGTAGDGGGLPFAGPGADTRAPRTGGEVAVVLLVTEAFHPPCHEDLAAYRVPGEDHTGAGVGLQGAALAGGVVGEETNAGAVVPLHEHGAPARQAGRLDRCQHHGVGFGQADVVGLLEP